MPSAKLHINSSTSPAVRIVDGTQGAGKVLVSDDNGNAAWTLSAATKPTIAGILPSTTTTLDTNWRYSSVSIILPPGNWLVQAGTTVIKDNPGVGVAWMNFSLCDTPTAFASTSDTDLTKSGPYYITDSNTQMVNHWENFR